MWIYASSLMCVMKCRGYTAKYFECIALNSECFTQYRYKYIMI